MLGEFRPRRPPRNFNLLYLQSNQVYFMSLKVSLVLGSASEEIEGRLHLCSRSIFFEHRKLSKPVIRMKYSSGLLLRMMKNIENRKMYKLAAMRKSQNQIKLLLSKGPNFLSQQLQKNQADLLKKPKTTEQNILMKLYQPAPRKAQPEQKIANCLFIRVPKILVIYRKPISPYITEKVEQNLIFQLSKTNDKLKVLRFLKIYDEIIKCVDEERLVQNIISATLDESTQDLLQEYKQQKLTPQDIIRCRRVKIQGCETGQLILLKNITKYIPQLNCPETQLIEFTFHQIKYMTRYRYLFEEKGIEIWLFNYPHSILLVFPDQQTREFVFKYLRERADKAVNIDMEEITEKWTDGHISNVQYLNYLNSLASRSHNDLSQYPVFPWIFHAYEGEFDLKNPEMYRDLTKPIGAINKHRLRKLKDFYQMQSKDKTNTNPPHLYSTHYSTPGYVAYYLLRKIPEFIVRLQNGVFNPSDRIFRCVESAYFSSMNSPADFKQLTPQFYSSDCDFLVNSQKLQMGSTPQGQVIDDVIIAKWAKSPEDFLLKSRAAFESDYVSAYLHDWVDLIFGYKQSGVQAITSDNVFYYLTYQQNVNFQRPMSRMERAALEVQVSEFGQTPARIFDNSHPSKKVRIVNLGLAGQIDDRRISEAKMMALAEDNERLQEKLERQKYRFNKKLNEKEEMLIKMNKEKKKDIQKLKQALSIDQQSLRKFEFKPRLHSNQEKDVYIRQLEQIVKQRERKNAELQIVLAGIKRTATQHDRSLTSEVNQIEGQQRNFFEDDTS